MHTCVWSSCLTSQARSQSVVISIKQTVQDLSEGSDVFRVLCCIGICFWPTVHKKRERERKLDYICYGNRLSLSPVKNCGWWYLLVISTYSNKSSFISDYFILNWGNVCWLFISTILKRWIHIWHVAIQNTLDWDSNLFVKSFTQLLCITGV